MESYFQGATWLYNIFKKGLYMRNEFGANYRTRFIVTIRLICLIRHIALSNIHKCLILSSLYLSFQQAVEVP